MDDEFEDPEQLDPERCATCSLLLTQDEIDCEYLDCECFDCHGDEYTETGRYDRHHEGREPGESDDLYDGD